MAGRHVLCHEHRLAQLATPSGEISSSGRPTIIWISCAARHLADRQRAYRLAVLQHRDFVGNLKDLVQPV